MENQRDLFGDTPTPEPTAPFQKHSPASIAAAAAIKPDLNRLQSVVLSTVRLAGRRGMTDEEIQDALKMNASTQRPRRIELVRKGLIEQAGNRKTRSGRSAAVWVFKENRDDNQAV